MELLSATTLSFLLIHLLEIPHGLINPRCHPLRS
jgi:hypothetical protein